MRITRFITTALSGVFVAGLSTVAYASCGPAFSNLNCTPGTIAHPGPVDTLSAVNTYEQLPYGYLKTFAYKNTPNVNIMRLHSRTPSVTLADRPIAFTQGCTPTSTVYCRAPRASVNPVIAPTPRPVAPYIAPPVRPQYRPQYRPQMSYAPHYLGPIAPRPMMGGNVIGQTMSHQYTYQPQGGGAYWEKASGPAIVDGLPATQIICRRQAPRPAPVTVNVVRPVIGVPTPVPTPVYTQEQPQCAPVDGYMAHSRYGR